jgi:hypothetical protein
MPLLVECWRTSTTVESDAQLEALLLQRDPVGGNWFWLKGADGSFPVLAMRTSGDWFELHYFPDAEHAGFRCEGERQPTGMHVFRFVGCDPASGEEIPNEFVLSREVATTIAKQFLRDRRCPTGVAWLEL